MPYFTHGETKYKIIILYILYCAGSVLTADQLYRTAILNSEMEYFSFWEAVNELEEDGFIAAVRKSYGDCYGLTDYGRDARDMFDKTVPAFERKKIDAYLEANRASFVRETQLSSRIDKHRNGTATLHLVLTEQDHAFFTLSLDTPSEEQAIEMRSHWEANSEPIYNFVWDSLLKQPEKK